MTWPHDPLSAEERLERKRAVEESVAKYSVRRELDEALLLEIRYLNDEGIRVLTSLVARLLHRGAEPVGVRLHATMAWLQERDGMEPLAW